jgi:hypothetical protein
MARDGVNVYFECPGPMVRGPQPKVADPKVQEMVKQKILKVMRRRYLVGGHKIKSLIKYFAVPKGDDDIRLVYDATANWLMNAFGSRPFGSPPLTPSLGLWTGTCG